MAMPQKKRILDLSRLQADLSYSAATGRLTWTGSRKLNRRVGKVAGSVGNRGYIVVHYRGQYWLAHVLAWALTFKELPGSELDHINRDKTDNRIVNLRLVTHAENMANHPNAGTHPGVQFNRREQKWIVRFQRRGTVIHVGTFATREAAVAARATALNALGGS